MSKGAYHKCRRFFSTTTVLKNGLAYMYSTSYTHMHTNTNPLWRGGSVCETRARVSIGRAAIATTRQVPLMPLEIVQTPPGVVQLQLAFPPADVHTHYYIATPLCQPLSLYHCQMPRSHFLLVRKFYTPSYYKVIIVFTRKI